MQILSHFLRTKGWVRIDQYSLDFNLNSFTHFNVTVTHWQNLSPNQYAYLAKYHMGKHLLY